MSQAETENRGLRELARRLEQRESELLRTIGDLQDEMAGLRTTTVHVAEMANALRDLLEVARCVSPADCAKQEALCARCRAAKRLTEFNGPSRLERRRGLWR